MNLDKASTRYVALMVTHQCNLKCVYCYEQFKDSKAIDVENAKNYIKEAFEETAKTGKYKTLELSFMGGEPLTEFSKIKEICEWLWAQTWPMDYIVFASTNGTLLTAEAKNWLDQNKDRIVLGLSLDGSLASQSSNRGSLAAAIDIDFFVKTWPDQGIKATISKQSIGHLAEDIKFIHEKGFNLIYTNLAFGIDWDKDELLTYKNQLLKLVDFYIEHPEYKRCSLLDMDLHNILDNSTEYEKYCGCGEGTILIDIDGKEYPCPVLSPISLPDDKLKLIENIDFSDPERFIDPKCKNCLLWKNCPKCYGMNLMATGDPAKAPEFNCVAYKIQILANCLLHEKMLKQNLISEDKKKPTKDILNILEFIFNHQN